MQENIEFISSFHFYLEEIFLIKFWYGYHLSISCVWLNGVYLETHNFNNIFILIYSIISSRE